MAYYGMMDWYGGSFSGGLGMLFYLILFAFIFSLIFWWTYKLIIKPEKKK